MAKGVPTRGYRITKKRLANPDFVNKLTHTDFTAPVVDETDDQINERIATRFDILEKLTHATISGDSRALIISGPAGLGKSFSVERILKHYDPDEKSHSFIKGYVKATGLYKQLYEHREAGQVLVFDDADSIFKDDVCLNMLKAVCDTNDERTVSYLAENNLISENGAERVPRTFKFEGSIIFITNLDFDAYVDKGHHLAALISRAYYIDLTMKCKRDYIIRIKQVVNMGMLTNLGLQSTEQKRVMDFVIENVDRMRELSLRSVLKIGKLIKAGGDWKNIAEITCLRN